MKQLIFFWSLLTAAFGVAAQQTPQQFNIPVNYLLYLPKDYQADTATRFPLVIFLHGSGESGTDINQVKVNGIPKLIEQGRKFPFIVVSPQAAPGMGWNQDIFDLFFRQITQQYRVDLDMIYLTGLSMGGYGTWAIAMRHPDNFAAIVPICGGGDTTNIRKLKHMPVWAFHGGKDDVVNPQQSKTLIEALKKYNNNVRLTIFPEAGHDSWTQAYATDSLYSWLLQQRRFRFARVPVAARTLQEFAGRYAQKGKDSADLIVADGKLVVKQMPQMELVPFAKDSFFTTHEDRQQEVLFRRDSRGEISAFTFDDGKIVEFLRIRTK